MSFWSPRFRMAFGEGTEIKRGSWAQHVLDMYTWRSRTASLNRRDLTKKRKHPFVLVRPWIGRKITAPEVLRLFPAGITSTDPPHTDKNFLSTAMDRPGTPDLQDPCLKKPALQHPTPERAKGKIIGAEETKDAGILTRRSEYDVDGIGIPNVDNPPVCSEAEARCRQRLVELAVVSGKNTHTADQGEAGKTIVQRPTTLERQAQHEIAHALELRLPQNQEAHVVER